MPFISPLILLGALAGLIPVAIHFFFRSRYRTVPWAAMKFLLTSVEQTSRRVKFQEYLLLLLRIAVLVFLAVALARPINLSDGGFLYLLGAVAFTIFALTWVLFPFEQYTNSRAVGIVFLIGQAALASLMAAGRLPLDIYLIGVVASIAIFAFIWLTCFLWNWGGGRLAKMAIWGGSQAVLLILAIAAWLPLVFGGMTGPAAAARGEGDAVDAVFVIDTSYSMGAIDQDGQTRLALAKTEALKIIDELPPHSTVQIIACAGKGRNLIGPHSPGDLTTARRLIDEIDIVHLGTDLYPGAYEAKEVLARGQATNKELYVFSDMQKLGFEQQAGELKSALTDIKEKAVVHLVRCGTRTPKNVAVVDIAPQAGVPRPGERVGFAIQIKNTGADAVEKLTVSLAVNGDDKKLETARINKINPGEVQAVTLDAKLDKPGLHVLTAKVATDDLDADNRFDQVIHVREQANILVVDGNYNRTDRDAEKSSSYYLMHSIVPVLESARATYKYHPRLVTAAAATPEMLQKQDVCILVNCAVPGTVERRGDLLRGDFVDALDSFVRKGHGLIVFAGDNVRVDPYNKLLGKKLGLLPMPLKATVKANGLPLKIDRKTFGQGPTAYQKIKDDDYYKAYNFVEIWQHVEFDEPAVKAGVAKKIEPAEEDAKEPVSPKDEAASVIVRMNNGQALIANRKVDGGEVVFVGTAAHHEGFDAKLNPNWTNFADLPTLVMFLDITIGHLLRGQGQDYNLVAGQPLHWYPTEKIDYVYSLVHPDGKATRLGLPEREKDKRYVVTALDLPRAGIYRMMVMPRGMEGTDTVDPADATKHGVPIAVIPDLAESADLTSLSDAEIDARLGFVPIHITAGVEQGASAASERDKREWTVWALLAVLALVLIEVPFAWWCGKGW